jgi:predicted MFS family arabinose efflux permease
VTITLHRLKAGYLGMVAGASIATSYYFNYLFFFLHDRYGFGNRENLAVAALHGAIYIVASWQAGRFAERRGFHLSLKIGFTGLLGCMLAGSLVDQAWLELVILACYSSSVCFLWPAIAALITEHEPPARVPHMVGLYNCTWSTASAVAYFTGGTLYDWLGKGAIVGIPAAVFAVQLAVTIWLDRRAATVTIPVTSAADTERHPDPRALRQPVPPAVFLKLAWVANPFSYVTIYTLIATMPSIAARFGLTPAEAGLVCSVWLFGRLAAFVGLWNWTGWHYRFRFLIGGFVALAISFVVILVAPAVWMMIAAQVTFGLACGLMYYSSLFYSMDVGDAKAEHSGFHEAAIGVGICAGPALGSASLYLFPTDTRASAVAVSGLLVVGLVMLLTIWTRARAGHFIWTFGSPKCPDETSLNGLSHGSVLRHRQPSDRALRVVREADTEDAVSGLQLARGDEVGLAIGADDLAVDGALDAVALDRHRDFLGHR